MASGTPATALLTRRRVPFTLHPYVHDPRAESYGAEAADLLGVDARRLFKTLVADVDGAAVCAVVPVAGHLDLKALARARGGKRAAMTEPAVVQRITGYVLGGVSPLGQRTALPVVLDTSAEQFDTVFVSAGRRGLQVELAPGDLLAVAGATLAAIAAS